ncbi:MAG: hypothetical protein FWD18_01810 [Micrococcales bacterium]|nr:hypothetical protein [Micrococcales bacterium]
MVAILALVPVALVASLGGCSHDGASGPLFSDEDIAAMPEFQRNILEDGVVTYAEYESAVIAQRSCLEEAGYSPGEIEDIGGGQIGFIVEVDYSHEPDPAAADALFLATDRHCNEEYLFYVGTAWAESQVITDPAERERLRAQFASCLKDAGLRVSADDDVEALLEAVRKNLHSDIPTLEAVSRCEHDASRLFAVSIRGR